jgi:hypothetical protein
VFVILHRRGVSLVDDGGTRAWLRETAWRVASNHRRGRTRAENRRAQVQPSRPVSTPEELTARAEIATELASFLAGLPTEARELFERVEIDGASVPEIAHERGANLDTTYAQIRRTRARWAARLAAIGVAIVVLVLATLGSRCDVAPELAEREDPRDGPPLLDAADHDRRSPAVRPDADRVVRAARGDRHPARPPRGATTWS